MTRLAFLLVILPALAFAAPPGARPPAGSTPATDKNAVHKTGEQSMEGPLSSTGGFRVPVGVAYCTDASCLGGFYSDAAAMTLAPVSNKNLLLKVGGTGSVLIPSGAKLCMDGAACSVASWWNGSSTMSFGGPSGWAVSFGGSLASLGSAVDLRGSISNAGSANGGSVSINDPLRFLSTTTAIIESSTSATGGSDTGFNWNTLNSLSSGTDYHSTFTNNGTLLAYVGASGAVVATGNVVGAKLQGNVAGTAGTPFGSIRYTTTVDITSHAVGGCETNNLSLGGAVAPVGSECVVGKPATLPAGWFCDCTVTAADATIRLTCCNVASATTDPDSGTFSVRLFTP